MFAMVVLLALAQSAATVAADQARVAAAAVAEPVPAKPEEPWPSVPFQDTVITHHHGSFASPYPGTNSLQAEEPRRTSVTSTLLLGTRLPWAGGQMDFDPEIAAGEGFSGVSGIAGFPKGELPRDHRDYLAGGGYGFIIGDGKLPHYEPEAIGGLYELFKLAGHVFLTADLQYVRHPAYNPDRGPVVVDGIRAHVEF